MGYGGEEGVEEGVVEVGSVWSGLSFSVATCGACCGGAVGLYGRLYTLVNLGGVGSGIMDRGLLVLRCRPLVCKGGGQTTASAAYTSLSSPSLPWLSCGKFQTMVVVAVQGALGHSVSFLPNCTVYDKENKDITKNNSALSDLSIEFKNRPEEDAFSTHFMDESPTQFMSQKTKGVITAGQITTYTALQLDCQYHTHVFSVLISGAIVTAPIYYQQDPALWDFFTCYDNTDRSMRGHDDSVRYATQAKTRKAIDANIEFSISQKLLVVNVPLQWPKSGYSSYIIKPPVGQFYTPPGRVTHTSIAYNIKRNCIVFFKDSWRVDCNGIKREGEIYAMLNNTGVLNVPRCLASGDVGKDIYHSTHTNRKDMVRAILAALIAHRNAYNKCRILHRDISPTNILLTECSDFEDNPSAGGACQPTRTGTWQFMVADLIVNPKISHTFIHNIKSVFFVLLWMATHYVQLGFELLTRFASGFVGEL
ncbi:hypothetical protein EDB84DRAFT_1434043 [Lactarius hengduanensis]|nr:hypothetical protein EDB84DRAFT_1434043 [Lactarius hengduanensis]